MRVKSLEYLCGFVFSCPVWARFFYRIISLLYSIISLMRKSDNYVFYFK